MVEIFIFFLNKIKCIKTEPNQIEPNSTELTSGFDSTSNTNKLTEKYTQKIMIAWW